MEGQPVKLIDSQTEKAPQAIIRYLPDHNQAARTSVIDHHGFNPCGSLGIPACRVDKYGVTFLALADDPPDSKSNKNNQDNKTSKDTKENEPTGKEQSEKALEKDAVDKPGEAQFKGSLYLIGGSARKCFDDVIKLAGDNPRIAVVGLASGTDRERANPVNVIDEELAENFVKRGIAPGDITIIKPKGFIPTHNRFKYSYDVPADSSLVYFGGGDQGKLRERFDDKQLSQVKKLLFEGSTVAGNSAGTAIMSSEMIADGEVANLPHSPGFGLTPWAIMDTHVNARPIRIQRDVKAYFEIGNQKLPVIGLDEDTSLKISWKNAPFVDVIADATANGAPVSKPENARFRRVLVGEVGGSGQAHITDAKESRLKFNRAITPRASTNGLDKREAFLYELSANDSFAFLELP